jgi:type III pantothenate kinase
MKILIDIGNSYLKWVIYQNDAFTETVVLNYRETNWQYQLHKDWINLTKPEAVVIANVAGIKILTQLQLIIQKLWGIILIIIPQSCRQYRNLINGYICAETLGIDRWINLIAAESHYAKQNIWMVDAGTAITIDLLDYQGQHQGGLIAPGLKMMQAALIQNTAQLITSQNTNQFGLSYQTDTAIFNGCLAAIIGLIIQTIRLRSEVKTMILTGGDCDTLYSILSQQYLAVNIIQEPQFIFKGLALISES